MAKYTNASILGKWMLNGTNDFAQRLPNGTQTAISQTIKALFDPMNQMYYNDFCNFLVNRIGMTKITNDKEWNNPLGVFKKESLYYGSTVQEIAPKWLKAHSYLDDDDTLLAVARPEIDVAYHTMNRQDRYDLTINRAELMQAFTQEYGLDSFISALMRTPYNSDNYDEYLSCKQLIAEYEKYQGFFKVNVAELTDEESGKAFLKTVKGIAGQLHFPSALYNSSKTDVPTFINNNSELVIIMTPDAQAVIDVDAYATLFNLEKAELQERIVLVDELPIAGAQALLTTEDFFVMHDVLYETRVFDNPQTLGQTYYLHHWEVLSVSPFVPAILLTTQEGTLVPTVTETVTSLNVSGSDTAEPGETVQLTYTLNGTLTSDVEGVNTDALEIAPDSVITTVSAMTTAQGEEGDDDYVAPMAIQLNTRTWVDKHAVLHIQKSGLKAGDVITVHAVSTYWNPDSNVQETYTADHSVTIA